MNEALATTREQQRAPHSRLRSRVQRELDIGAGRMDEKERIARILEEWLAQMGIGSI